MSYGEGSGFRTGFITKKWKTARDMKYWCACLYLLYVFAMYTDCVNFVWEMSVGACLSRHTKSLLLAAIYPIPSCISTHENTNKLTSSIKRCEG